MELLTVILGVYLVLATIYWLRMLAGVVRLQRGVPKLESVAPPDAGATALPRLSVIVPARDEAAAIESAAATLLAQDYPDLQVIFVDDRSVDETGAIMDRLAADDERVRVLHVDDLPNGWLGKVHSLSRGWQASDGALVLLTDADVHFVPHALRAAVATMLARRLDHLAACPAVWPSGPIVDVMVAAFLRQLLAVGLPPGRVARPDSSAYFGVGAFNLVRREAFEAGEGWEWLKMETADDMGVGLLMKRSGARCGVVAAFEHVGLHWYGHVRAAARGAEKGYASIGNCRAWRIVASAAVMGLLELSPVAAAAAVAVWAVAGGPAAWNAALGAGVVAVFAAAAVWLARWAQSSVAAALATPLAAPLSVMLMLRVAWLGWRRGGVVWRGRLYPSAALRAGRRVRPHL